MSGLGQGGDGGILCGVGGRGQTRINEDSVVAVGARRDWMLAVDRDDTEAPFAGAFGDELFEPAAEARDAG